MLLAALFPDNDPMRIDQVLPSLVARDAIGLHTLEVRELLRSEGFRSDIYYLTCTPDVAREGHPLSEIGAPRGDRWILYQLSIGSPAAEIVLERPEPKIVNYHNITPAELIAPWEPEVAFEVDLGRKQMARLAPVSRLAIADSAFNESELREVGYAQTTVVPLLIDFSARSEDPDPSALARLEARRRHGGADLLFVGKVSPHKAQHELLKAFALFKQLYDPRARLHLVGSPLGEKYIVALEQLVAELGLFEDVEVTGSVSSGELAAYYRVADAFVCASKHEGFCVPLVEAMARGLPVIAYATAAIPETVADAGIVVPPGDALQMATAMQKVTSDGRLRAALQEAGMKRASELSIVISRERFKAEVHSALAAAGRTG